MVESRIPTQEALGKDLSSYSRCQCNAACVYFLGNVIKLRKIVFPIQS